MGFREFRLGGALLLAVAFAGLAATPAMGGVQPTGKQNVVNFFKVGKFHVGVTTFSDSSEAEIYTRSQFLGYEGKTKKLKPGLVKADFGDFGKVSLRFHKAGPFHDQKLRHGCTGTPSKKQKGTWKGVFKLKTEQSIVDVTRHELKGSLIKPGMTTCPIQPFPDATSLNLINPDLQFHAEVPRSGGKSQFLSFADDKRRGAFITRGLYARGKHSDFTYEPDFSAAELSPPAPYSGTGIYTADDTPRGTLVNTQGPLTGHLKGDFLGLDGKIAIKGPNAQLGEGGGIFRRTEKRAARLFRSGRW